MTLGCLYWSTLFAFFCWQVSSISLETEQTLRAKVQDQPLNRTAHLKLMQWHLKWGELGKAMEVLKAAIIADPTNTWQYQERIGDLQWKYAKDQHSAEARYRAALEANPRAKRALLHYGMLQVWRGRQDEADKLFQQAVDVGLLRDAQQRPLDELDTSLPSRGPWGTDEHTTPKLAPVLAALREGLPMFWEEYLKWNRTRHQDAEVDSEGFADPHGTGQWQHFWVYNPRFERGVWNSACHYKTPKTCKLLKRLNATVGGVRILRADFDVLTPGATIRPHCHATNTELLIDVCLRAPRHGVAIVHAKADERAWLSGDVRVLDPSFEHGEQNRGYVGQNASRLGTDYLQELRSFYAEQGKLEEKESELDSILKKWNGREEKMIRELRKKYLNDRGERVLFRLLVRNPDAKEVADRQADRRGVGDGSIAAVQPEVEASNSRRDVSTEL
eukprot:TRINITY_DN34714_c0_g1_i1.p1 TRINITY_DN34714_c0_g1~~TRINITY_DN34714_c0_g1_i1.p1  ORF type:complete len:445 (+),score=62.83 TRINITY_DN34714_c0_g1_i1:82-1416(+)